MNGHPDLQTTRYIGYGVFAVVILMIYFFRFRSAGKPRPLQPGMLLIRPAILVVFLALALFVAQPYDAQSLGILAACLLVGAAIGWWRGKMVHVEVHPETHAVSSVTPVFALVLIVALLIGRMALRLIFFPNMADSSHPAMLINAYFLAFAVGALGVTSLEIYLRAQRLLGEAKAKSGA